jgi:hypothetical protein
MIENALENPNLIQVGVVPGCTIMVAPQKSYGIDYLPNGEYRSWTLTGYNTRLNRTEAHYIYARLERGSDDAMVLFSVNDYATDGSIGGENPSEDFYYIRIGIITATDSLEAATLDREITLDYGKLSTPEGQMQDTAGWKELFEVTADDLIRPLKRFTSYIVQGTLSIIGKLVINDKQITDVARQGDDEEFTPNDEAIPTTKLLTGKYLKYLRSFFLNKDQEDSTDFVQTFRKGVKMGSYTTGVLGSGGAVLVDANGNTHAEFDYLNIRKKALFTDITVQELKHVGGALILSPAAMIISSVEETEDGYKCYFNRTDGEGRSVYNEFEPDDQGRCQTFNLEVQPNGQKGNRYWWRLVIETGDDYVVFSKTDADTGSDIPQAGDQVSQLGNRTDVTRQNAQIYSAYGSDSPSRKMYQGINSYSLEDKVIKDEYFDVVSGRFKEVTYGDTYTGNRQNTSYFINDEDEGVSVAGKVQIQAGSTGAANLDDLPQEIQNAVKVGGENLLRNTSFCGDYQTVSLSSDTPLKSSSQMYSPSLKEWEGTGQVSEDAGSASGFSCASFSIYQNINLIEGETYMLGYKAKGTSVTFRVGDVEITQELTSEYARYTHQIVYNSGNLFSANGPSATICEIKLERGTIATDWCPSRDDTDPVADGFKQFWYIQDAIKGSTQTIGGLSLLTMIQLGKWVDGVMEKVNAGVSGIYNEDTDVAFWAGGTFEQAMRTVTKMLNGEQPTDEEWKDMAKFVATHGGNVFLRGYIYALGGVFRGTIYSNDGEFGGTVKIANGKILLNKDGSGSLANGSLYWDKEGNLYQNSNFEVSAKGYTLKIDREFADFRIYDSEDRMVVAIQPFSDIYGSTPVIYLKMPDYQMGITIDVTGINIIHGEKAERQAYFGLDGISFQNEYDNKMKGITDSFRTTDSLGKTWEWLVCNGIIYKKYQV